VFANYCFWSTIVPVVVGLVGCGVMVSVLPETQYEYGVLYRPLCEVVSVLPEVVYSAIVVAIMFTTPIPPVCWTWFWHVHPPPAASVQVPEA
jgi:hypothetical protein